MYRGCFACGRSCSTLIREEYRTVRKVFRPCGFESYYSSDFYCQLVTGKSANCRQILFFRAFWKCHLFCGNENIIDLSESIQPKINKICSLSGPLSHYCYH